MLRFRYHAIDHQGRRVSDELDAETWEGAITDLQDRALRVEQIEQIVSVEPEPPADEPAVWLSNDEFAETAGRLADVTRAGLPLASGLRALGEEAPSRRVRRALGRLSGRLERGESLDTVAASPDRHVPWDLQGVIAAGVRTNRLGPLLDEYLEATRRAVDLRRRTVAALLYPGCLLLAAMVVVGFFLWLVPGFGVLFGDFGVELPIATAALLWLSTALVQHSLWILAGLAVLVAGAWAFVRLVGGSAAGRRLFCWIPVVGPMFRYSSLAAFCRLLALLVENRTPLPSALGIASRASRDADLEQACRDLAQDLETGIAPDQAAALTLLRFPIGVRQPFRWAGRPDAFVGALRAAGEIFDQRARAQTELLPAVCEPLIIVSTAMAVGFVFVVLFLPLIQLLGDLT